MSEVSRENFDVNEPITVTRLDQENWVDNHLPYIINMVGLPGRGKSYMAKRIKRWLNWKGLHCQVFNLGHYRRRLYPQENTNSSWFDHHNEEQAQKRQHVLDAMLSDLKEWVMSRADCHSGGLVGIIDATNTTKSRRDYLYQQLSSFIRPDRILWVETICDQFDQVIDNIKNTKIGNEDYKDSCPDEVITDFLQRIDQYQRIYQQMDSTVDESYKFIQIHNMGRRIVMSNISQQLDQKISHFLINLKPKSNTVYLTLHGQQVNDHLIGVTTQLTSQGREYAEKLKTYFDQHQEGRLQIMTSTKLPAAETSRPFEGDGHREITQWRYLDPLDHGEFKGLTREQAQERWPKTYHLLSEGPSYRYSTPGGESFRRMIIRLENIFLELEREQSDILIITHREVAQGIYAYLMMMPPEEGPNVEIETHRLYSMTHLRDQPCIQVIDL
jgi:6-phosphofructo-2-kinase/fructose-2,6-biphosphatase 2